MRFSRVKRIQACWEDQMKADTNVAATSASPLFNFRENEWFAMERTILGDPDCSPMKILITKSAKKERIIITFYEAFYPEGVKININNAAKAELETSKPRASGCGISAAHRKPFI